jgi:hypothetical protein
VAAATLLGVLLVMSAYTLRKYEPATFPGTSLEQMAWIDEATGGRQSMVWGYASAGVDTGRHYQSSLAMYFNASACCYAGYNELPDQIGPEGQLPPFAGVSKYITKFGGYHPVGFETEIVARSAVWGEEMRVERFIGAPGAAYKVTGAGLLGEVGKGQTATFGLFPKAREPGKCLELDLTVPPDTPEQQSKRALPFRLEAGDDVRTGTVRPGRVRHLSVPLADVDAVTVTGPRGGKVPLLLGENRLAACRAR